MKLSTLKVIEGALSRNFEERNEEHERLMKAVIEYRAVNTTVSAEDDKTLEAMILNRKTALKALLEAKEAYDDFMNTSWGC